MLETATTTQVPAPPRKKGGWTIASCNRRQWVWMVVLIAVSGIIKGGWGQVRFITEAIFGPMATAVFGGFFLFWGMLAAFGIRKFGAATLVMTLGTPFELAAGNPFGQLVWVFNFFEGLGADVGFALFLDRFSGREIINLAKSAVVGIVDETVGFVAIAVVLGLFTLPPNLVVVFYVTSTVAVIFYGIFAYGMYKTLLQVRAIPPSP